MDILLDAWSGAPPDRRAAMVAAQGDLSRAASYARGVWNKLLNGDVKAVMEAVAAAGDSPGMAFVEAEALFTAGAVVAGLQRLEELHGRGDPAGTLALARRRHQLGDHAGAVRAAQALPWHAHSALTGARAALANDQPGIALRFVEPYLQGYAPLPEPAVAAAFAVTTAAILARFGEYTQLRRFVDRLMPAGDLTEDMMPAVARAAWIGGRGREAWHRFDVAESPWCVASRLELATLAGDTDLAEKLLSRAGPLGVPAKAALQLLQGLPDTRGHEGNDYRLTDNAREVFAEGRTVHVWRTHPHRWAPWIEAARRTPADVVVCDLVASQLPETDSLPWAVMDDGALVDALAPVPVAAAREPVRGVRVGTELCRGVAVGLDWPDEEDGVVRGSLTEADGVAVVEIVSADDALAKLGSGRPVVAVAPPGDPFWAGPIPERVWQAVRVVRASPQNGWQGAGARVVAAAEELLRSDDQSSHERGSE